MKKMYKLNLLVYPILQMVCFGAAVYFVSERPTLAGVFVVLAAFFMSFSLHITYHHHVHHKSKSKALNFLIEFLVTINLGLPFHFYKLQHLNHHKHNNEVCDMTSTYEVVGSEERAKPFLPYVFLWFLNTNSLKNHLEGAKKDGYFSELDAKKMRIESLWNLLVVGLLLYFGWIYLLLFGIMFYLGWSLIALHNYGQHLPTKKHQVAFSYYGRLYNLLFMNNGLHYEHHIYPNLGYWDLKADKAKERTNIWTHLLDGFRFIFNNKVA